VDERKTQTLTATSVTNRVILLATVLSVSTASVAGGGPVLRLVGDVAPILLEDALALIRHAAHHMVAARIEVGVRIAAVTAQDLSVHRVARVIKHCPVNFAAFQCIEAELN